MNDANLPRSKKNREKMREKKESNTKKEKRVKERQ